MHIFPNLSQSLFKYGPLEYVERTLKDKTLGFQPISEFNDIYENEYRLVHYFNKKDDLLTQHNAISPVLKAIDAQLKKYRVSCFSRRGDIALMWSHYSEHHRGVCYCFGIGQSRPDKIFAEPMGWGNVAYSSQIPQVKVFQKHTTWNMLDAIASDVILTKPIEWSYEEEVRFWTTNAKSAVSYDPSKLRAIIVGRRTEHDSIEGIKSLIAELNKSTGCNVELWYTFRHPSRFTLGVTNDFDFRNNSEHSVNADVPILSSKDSKPLTP